MLEVGSSYSETRVASEEIIEEIAKISGDINPIHLDETYAKDSVFGRRVAHALFCQNIISMIIGNFLPGKGAILVSQTFKYHCPVYLGDKIEATVVVKEVLPKGKYVLDTVCRNQTKEIVLTGVSIIKWQNK